MKPTTTTTDGWLISTVEQDGRYAGEEIGKVWLKDLHARCNHWCWYAADSVPDARRLAARAATGTKADFEAYYDTQS